MRRLAKLDTNAHSPTGYGFGCQGVEFEGSTSLPRKRVATPQSHHKCTKHSYVDQKTRRVSTAASTRYGI